MISARPIPKAPYDDHLMSIIKGRKRHLHLPHPPFIIPDNIRRVANRKISYGRKCNPLDITGYENDIHPGKLHFQPEFQRMYIHHSVFFWADRIHVKQPLPFRALLMMEHYDKGRLGIR